MGLAFTRNAATATLVDPFFQTSAGDR